MNKLLLTTLSMPLVACVIDEQDGDLELGEIASDLCSDGAPNATVAYEINNFGGRYFTKTSTLPTDGYGSRTCSDRYTVEVTNLAVSLHAFNVIGDWGESLPATQGACELALANVQTHEYRMVSITCNAQTCWPVYGWQQVGNDITLRGKWQLGAFGGSYHCDLVPDSPLPLLLPDAQRSKVRVAVRAYAWALFFPSYKRGEAGLYEVAVIY